MQADEVLDITPEIGHEASMKVAEREQPLTGWLRVIDRMITEKVSPELLGKVFELQAKAEAEMQRKEFVQAFAAFKSEAPAAIERTGRVGYKAKGGDVGYDHVELDVAVGVLTPILSRHGLGHSWDTAQDEKGLITVSCRLEHVAGHARTVTLRAMADTSGSKNPIQAVGSTIYYLERYTFLAVLGIAQKGMDNDAMTPGETLNPEQVKEINDMLERSKSNLPRFWKWVGTFQPNCQSVEAILQSNFAKVGDALEKAIRKAEGS